MRGRIGMLGLLLLPALGCTGMNNTQQGALSGGVIGTTIGALAGGPRGALIGAAAGTGLGAVAGNVEDRRDDRRAHAVAVQNAQAARSQMALSEIVEMTRQNVHDDIIINQINSSGSVFELRADDIIYLRSQGVSNRVISEMQRRVGRAVVVQPRPAGRLVYVDSCPPPPPRFHGGVVYVH